MLHLCCGFHNLDSFLMKVANMGNWRSPQKGKADSAHMPNQPFPYLFRLSSAESVQVKSVRARCSFAENIQITDVVRKRRSHESIRIFSVFQLFARKQADIGCRSLNLVGLVVDVLDRCHRITIF